MKHLRLGNEVWVYRVNPVCRCNVFAVSITRCCTLQQQRVSGGRERCPGNRAWTTSGRWANRGGGILSVAPNMRVSRIHSATGVSDPDSIGRMQPQAKLRWPCRATCIKPCLPRQISALSIFQVYGSVLPRCLLQAVLGATAAGLLEGFDWSFVRNQEVWMHPYALHVFGMVLGFALVMRIQIAYHRFWEGATQCHLAAAKWADGVMQVFAFDEASQDAFTDAGFEFRFLVLHYASLMHACALIDMRQDVRRRPQHTRVCPSTQPLCPPRSTCQPEPRPTYLCSAGAPECRSNGPARRSIHVSPKSVGRAAQ
jgi:hypothetical protein